MDSLYSGKDPAYVALRINSIEKRMERAEKEEAEKEKKAEFEKRKAVALLRSNADDAHNRNKIDPQSPNTKLGLEPDSDSDSDSERKILRNYSNKRSSEIKAAKAARSAKHKSPSKSRGQWNDRVGSLNKRPGGSRKKIKNHNKSKRNKSKRN